MKNFIIQQVEYTKFQIDGKPPMLKMIYICSEPLHMYNESVCLEETGFARIIAERWWSRRTSIPVPATVDEALEHVHALRAPEAIGVVIEDGHPIVVEYYGKLKQESVRVVKGQKQ